jgi:hypothetical protein
LTPPRLSLYGGQISLRLAGDGVFPLHIKPMNVRIVPVAELFEK